MKFGYIKDGNKYVLYGEGNEILRTNRLAIAFSTVDFMGCTLHKHGSPKYVKDWYTKFINQLKEKGIETTQHFYIISPDIPVDEINKMINLTGCLPEYIKGMIDE